ncbi:hypothetical protein ILUMI_27416, partial [Ignelater luminosus]
MQNRCLLEEFERGIVCSNRLSQWKPTTRAEIKVSFRPFLCKGITKATMVQAVRNIFDGDLSVEQAAISFEIPRTTLSKYAMLADYFVKCSRLHHGLPPQFARKMSYDFATANDVNRNKASSLRILKATSLARAMSFNRPVMNNFYDNIEQVLSKSSNVGPERIYNIDETELTTVQGASKVIVPKR